MRKKRDFEISNSYTSRIIEVISDYLRRNVDYALLLDGLWGSGKTHFVNNALNNALNRIGFKILHISLFGKVCANDITKEILVHILWCASDWT